jgi:transposase
MGTRATPDSTYEWRNFGKHVSQCGDDPGPSGVRIATGHPDIRRGIRSQALQVQQSFGRDPFVGDLYIFRGRRDDLKIIWHDDVGMSLYAKRLERGMYIWPSAVDSVIPFPHHMASMLEATYWRNPQATLRRTLCWIIDCGGQKSSDFQRFPPTKMSCWA